MADGDDGRGEDNRSEEKQRERQEARHREEGRKRMLLLRATVHPVRRLVLRTLGESGEAHSPTWLADTLDLPLGTASYHLTVLHKFGGVEPTAEPMGIDTRQ
jgi:DNA-binding transcriptional ArsR family regulator